MIFLSHLLSKSNRFDLPLKYIGKTLLTELIFFDQIKNLHTFTPYTFGPALIRKNNKISFNKNLKLTHVVAYIYYENMKHYMSIQTHISLCISALIITHNKLFYFPTQLQVYAFIRKLNYLIKL